MKRIMVVVGGGRKHGNTEQLADAFIRGAQEAGHWVDKILLREMRINGCTGCNACRYQRPCVQRDDFNALVPLLHSCDLLVLASPLYFWTLSSSIKAFIERFYSLAEADPHPPLGRYERYPVRDAALLMTAADDNFWTFEQAVTYYRFTFIQYMGFHDKGMLLAGGCGDTNGRPRIAQTPYLEEARDFGRRIYSGPDEPNSRSA